MAEKKWIQGAIKHPGSFSSAAKKAGMSTSAYARKVAADPHASSKMKKKANLAKVLMAMHSRRKMNKKRGK